MTFACGTETRSLTCFSRYWWRRTSSDKAAQRDQEAADLDDDDPEPPAMDSDLPSNTPPMTPDATPKPKAQRNFTDPDSRIMVRDGSFLQAFNAQLAVDEATQRIVAVAVGNQGPDAQYFEPMLRRVVDNCNAVPQVTTADTGYWSIANMHAAEHMGTDPHIAVGAHHNDGRPVDEPPPLPTLRSPERAEMRAKLSSSEGHARYARRKATVEPVIGQIRTRGFQHFSMRGLLKARCEWLLVGATHNILKLWRLLVTTDRTQNADARRGFGWVVDRARRERTAMPA